MMRINKEEMVTSFADTYPKYVQSASSPVDEFGFDIDSVARTEPALRFLFKHWWRVELTGLEYLPKSGPALIVGNQGPFMPYPALMLLYALISHPANPRRLNILADMDWIADERLHRALLSLGFVPWSAENAKKLFGQGQLVVTFPEGVQGLSRPFSERYRLRPFDWTKLLPAKELKIPVFPFATLGCDEAVPVLTNLDWLARFLKLPAFPVTLFFPWLPMPANLASLPVKWKMRILKSTHYQAENGRNGIEQAAIKHSRFVEGEIQAELNRLLRTRIKAPF